MKAQGFPEVYHLKGGILKYLSEVPAQESLWQGECFVFDQRIALGHGLEAGTHEICPRSEDAIAQNDKNSPQYQEGISCPYCLD